MPQRGPGDYQMTIKCFLSTTSNSEFCAVFSYKLSSSCAYLWGRWSPPPPDLLDLAPLNNTGVLYR